MENEIGKLRIMGKTEKADALLKEMNEKIELYNDKSEEWKNKSTSSFPRIGKEEIAEVISSRVNIPITRITETEMEKLLNLENALHKRIIGQEDAIKAVSSAIRRARAGLKDPNRPIGSFIFVGPTGVGKPTLRRLSRKIFSATKIR